ncbi:MAG: ferrous iron transport protein B [Bacteroidales bacterium]|jgi:ferrous iron transport protein B|nr:ferrous iron transport protein B [Bacteroidales bacterium]
MTLNDLKNGEKGIIIKIRGRGEFLKRITEMGFIKGHVVEAIKAAPFNDPVQYKILSSELSIRRSDAALIDIIPYNKEDSNDYSFGYEGVIDTKKEDKPLLEAKGKVVDIVLIGNPNSGKTSLFNAISGSKEKVGNYSGVTVDVKKTVVKYKDYKLNIIDLPGTYSISAYTSEESFVRKYLFENNCDIVINVIDASNLERNLFLTTQLIDMDVKMVIALNMYDELQGKNDSFDYTLFGSMIGTPIVPTQANKKKNIDNLLKEAIQVYEGRSNIYRHIHINYGEVIERALERLSEKIAKSKNYSEKFAARYYAIRLLEKDKEVEQEIETWIDHQDLHEIAESSIKKIEQAYNEDSETTITNARYGFIIGALKETYKKTHQKKNKTLSEKIDSVLTHPLFGYPIFFFFIWLMFYCSFAIGNYPMQWIEWIVANIGEAVGKALPSGIFSDFISQGIIGGVGGVIVFLPNILILFFFISIMEDTGYMARATFLMDKLMHKIGLHGKSFVPMIVGFGCNVPAIMATRTLENKKDRLLTMLIIPFMSCSARLPVYILLIGTFFPEHPVLMLCALYLLGVILAIVFALIFKKTIIKTKDVPFVMELPPYRIPTLKSVQLNIGMKAQHYLKKMGGVILIASGIIWALGYFPQQDSNKIQDSYIASIGHFIEPVIKPLGFDWKIGVSLLAGTAAKEVVISTMGVLYEGNDESSVQSLGERLKNEKYSYGEKIGKPVFTTAAALSLLVFVLVYFPCVAVFSSVWRESGRLFWAVLLVTYTTAVAWILSFIVYNLALCFL